MWNAFRNKVGGRDRAKVVISRQGAFLLPNAQRNALSHVDPCQWSGAEPKFKIVFVSLLAKTSAIATQNAPLGDFAGFPPPSRIETHERSDRQKRTR
jgi:hypothetical protein